MIQSSESACVRNCTTLYDALQSHYNKPELSKEDFLAYTEKWFVFAMIWSIGATVGDEKSRKEIDFIIRDIEPMFPTTNTVFEYYINPDKKDWDAWESKLSKNQSFVQKEFHEIYI